jgi:hypothetical protein
LSFKDSSDKLDRMKKSFIQILFIFAAVVIILCFRSQASAGQVDLPFKIGEKMTFEVRWSFILAGEATLEVLPLKEVNGEDSYHIFLKMRTSDFVDIFYKVRDSIESNVDLCMDHSLRYLQTNHIEKGEDIRVDFDWEKGQAHYLRIVGDAKADTITIPPGTFDPLSVFYAFRLYNMSEKEKIIVPVTDGKKVVYGSATVIKREVIRVGEVKYDTFLVEPELSEIGSIFKMSSGAKLQIWVTADRRHIPVRISSKVSVGSFIAELTSYTEGSGAEKTIKKPAM